MTHGVHRTKINQRFRRNTTIPGSRFYKIDSRGKDTNIKTHYISPRSPPPFKPTHLIKQNKTKRIYTAESFMGLLAYVYSSYIFLPCSQIFSSCWPLGFLQSGKHKILNVKVFFVLCKSENLLKKLYYFYPGDEGRREYLWGIQEERAMSPRPKIKKGHSQDPSLLQ